MAAFARALPFASTVEPVYRGVAVGTIAGALAGMLVGGIGGRIAMRLAGAMSDPSLVGGARTENGNILGNVTVEGTLALVIFAGLLPGTVAGLGYVAGRPWLAPLGPWAGLAYALVLLASVGPALVLEPSNFDFRKFGSAPVNVAAFALLFPLFGLALGALVGPVERRIRTPDHWVWEIVALAGVLFAALILFVVAGALVSLLVGRAAVGDPRGFLLVYLAAAPAVLRLVVGRGARFTDARDLATAPRVLSYALLVAPAVLGLPSTLEAMRFLAR
jgi:hypothetical protein